MGTEPARDDTDDTATARLLATGMDDDAQQQYPPRDDDPRMTPPPPACPLLLAYPYHRTNDDGETLRTAAPTATRDGRAGMGRDAPPATRRNSETEGTRDDTHHALLLAYPTARMTR